MIESKSISKLLKRFEIGKLSHSFLIETNNVDKAYKDVKNLIKYINCSSKYDELCKSKDCNLCKLIDLDNLPSLITIKPDGMSIKKNQIEELLLKFNNKPIYSKYNSYIILNCESMNDSAANSILKFLEEPEDNIIGFYITNNKQNIISTIKSRCQFIKAEYDEKTVIDEDIVEFSNYYFGLLNDDSSIIISKDLIKQFSIDRLFLRNFLLYLIDLFSKKIKDYYFPGNNKVTNVSINQMKDQFQIVENLLHLNQYNVNLELLLDKFTIEMRRSFE